jgi:hypothetical protein
MSIDLGAPGVRFQRRRVRPAIPALRTDIAAFVGLAERGPAHRPVATESFAEFAAVFGGFSPNAFLAYTVKAFFDNGGVRAWIVRVTSDDPGRGARAATAPLPAGGVPAWTASASSPGQWGNRLSATLQPGRRRSEQSPPSGYGADHATVGLVDSFARGTHVRLSQPGGPTLLRVVSAVDPAARRLYWVHPDARHRLPYDAPVAGFDRNLPLNVESLTYTLVVRERGKVVAIHPDLTLVPEHPRYAPDVLRVAEPDEATPPPPVLMLPPDGALGAIPPALDDDPTVAVALTGGWDGLAVLRIDDFIGDVAASALTETAPRGLQATARIDEVAIVAMPDIHVRPVEPPARDPLPPGDPCDPCAEPALAPPADGPLPDRPPLFDDADIHRAQAAMLELCERQRDRFAILDAPYSTSRDERLGLSPVGAWRDRFDSAFGALYFPWAEVPDPLEAAPLRAVPPCGHVAGQMARLDLAVGVHRPPANVPLSWLSAVTVTVSEPGHALLNPRGINVLRARAGQGLRVLGARTLSSDPLWRFVNVRRLISMIAEAFDKGSQWAVFEPNDADTRRTLAASLSAFLLGLWQRGAFVGAAPEDAFAVRCDEGNNPPSARDAGRLQADVVVAPVNPFEYVVIRLGRVDDALQVQASAVGAGGGA